MADDGHRTGRARELHDVEGPAGGLDHGHGANGLSGGAQDLDADDVWGTRPNTVGTMRESLWKWVW